MTQSGSFLEVDLLNVVEKFAPLVRVPVATTRPVRQVGRWLLVPFLAFALASPLAAQSVWVKLVGSKPWYPRTYWSDYPGSLPSGAQLGPAALQRDLADVNQVGMNRDGVISSHEWVFAPGFATYYRLQADSNPRGEPRSFELHLVRPIQSDCPANGVIENLTRTGLSTDGFEVALGSALILGHYARLCGDSGDCRDWNKAISGIDQIYDRWRRTPHIVRLTFRKPLCVRQS